MSKVYRGVKKQSWNDDQNYYRDYDIIQEFRNVGCWTFDPSLFGFEIELIASDSEPYGDKYCAKKAFTDNESRQWVCTINKLDFNQYSFRVIFKGLEYSLINYIVPNIEVAKIILFELHPIGVWYNFQK